MQENPTHTVAILGYDGCNAVDVFGPMQVFSTANEVLKQLRKCQTHVYKLVLVAPEQSTLHLSTGTQIVADKRLERIRAETVDTLVIAGGNTARENAQNPKLLRAIERLDSGTRRTVSVCTGAFILAATGALEHRRATTHWKYAAEFKSWFRSTLLDIDSMFTQDGKYSCSAGVTAGIDLALHLVQEDHGRRVALQTAREMVAYYQRPGGQNQFSSVQGTRDCVSEPLQRVQQWLHNNLQQKLDVETLADRAHMSTRHFSRKFSDETGLSPARYLALARLNQARVLLEESTKSINQVASQCGYANAELMRRLFLKELNVLPSEYRKRFSIHRTQSLS